MCLKSKSFIFQHHSYRSYQGFTCLMQISSRTEDFLIDTIALRDELNILNNIFTNPNIVKVGFHFPFFPIKFIFFSSRFFMVQILILNGYKKILVFMLSICLILIKPLENWIYQPFHLLIYWNLIVILMQINNFN